MTKIRDFLIADDILGIIEEEVKKLKAEPERDVNHIVRLERLSKSYQIIMASNREAIKAGLMGNLSTKELDDSAGDSDEDTDDTDEL